MGPSCYIEYRGIRNHTIKGFYCTENTALTVLYTWPCVTTLGHTARLCFYQTRSAWSRDQGSNKNHSPAYNFALTVTKFCVMWEGLSLPHDTKFGNCRCKIVDSRKLPIWSLIHGSSWSGLIKAEPQGSPPWQLLDDPTSGTCICYLCWAQSSQVWSHAELNVSDVYRYCPSRAWIAALTDWVASI